MSIDDKLRECITKIKEGSKDRKFTQTVDLIINFKNIDLDNPENRFSKTAYLPNGRGKERSLCIIADSTKTDAKKLDVNLITRDELEALEGNKDKVKEIANKNDYFLAEAPLMPKIGKIMGPVLGPRGKMPDPYAPSDDIEDIVKRSMNSININLGREPLIQLAVGTEDMDIDEIVENARTLIDDIEKNLPKGRQQIDSIYVKLTMSKPGRVI